MRILVVAAQQRTSVGDVQLRACNADDELCRSPAVARPTGDDGAADLDVEQGFSGYVLGQQSVSGGVPEPLIGFRRYLARPWTRDGTLHIIALTFPQLGGFFDAVGSPVGPMITHGHVWVSAEDCDGSPAAGVSFFLTRDRVPVGPPQYYGLHGQLSGNTTTAGDANGGFVNVVPGDYELRAELAGSPCAVQRQIRVEANTQTQLLGLVPYCP